MAIFMDTGAGDIYAGETRQACLDAMKSDLGEKEFQLLIEEASMEEVSGDVKVRRGNEDGSPGGLVTLQHEYDENGTMDAGYCIASSNV